MRFLFSVMKHKGLASLILCATLVEQNMNNITSLDGVLLPASLREVLFVSAGHFFDLFISRVMQGLSDARMSSQRCKLASLARAVPQSNQQHRRRSVSRRITDLEFGTVLPVDFVHVFALKLAPIACADNCHLAARQQNQQRIQRSASLGIATA